MSGFFHIIVKYMQDSLMKTSFTHMEQQRTLPVGTYEYLCCFQDIFYIEDRLGIGSVDRVVYSEDNLRLLHQNISCGYSLELSHWDNSNEYPQDIFWCKSDLGTQGPAVKSRWSQSSTHECMTLHSTEPLHRFDMTKIVPTRYILVQKWLQNMRS